MIRYIIYHKLPKIKRRHQFVMDIAFISDAHAEKYKSIPLWLPPLPDRADVLLLVGDMHVGADLIRLVISIKEQLPQTTLIITPGNHEFYGYPINELIEYYRDVFSEMKGVHFLYNESITIDGVTFIGTTLWSDFSPHKESYSQNSIMDVCGNRMSDFSLIIDDSDPDKLALLTPEKMRSLCEEAKAALDNLLSKSEPKNTVVMCHFPPRKEILNKNHQADEFTSFFTADCSEIFKKHKPAYCVYGHNHYSDEMIIDGTHFLSNQPGYLMEKKKNSMFDINRVISI